MSEEHETICFDFEQNLPFPHLPVGEVFYKRQLWFYNFGVHSCKTGKPVMYTWPEATARRGCREVISCLHHFINTKVPLNVKHLHLFSDGCRGQNYNHTMIRYLFTLVFLNRFQTINFHLPIRGHSFLPCDREFAVIERMKRKKDTVEMFSEWQAMIATKFATVSVTGHMIQDYKGHFDTLFKKTVTKRKEKFKISEYKRFRFTSSDRLCVFVSRLMSGIIESSFPLLKANAVPTLPTAPYYTSMVPVKKAKLDDVKSLSKYLSQPAIEYINSIPE